MLLGTMFAMPAQAQTESSGWYGGISAGIPYGYSSFRPTKVGYAGGLFAGYRFNQILSLEASGRMGRTILGACDCNRSLYLGSDGNHYFPAPDGITSWPYSALKSYVDYQQYGLQLNVNILGFFKGTRDSRWRLELSPKVSAVGTKADVRTTTLSAKTKWHAGLGGDLQASYWFTSHFGLGVYTEFTHLTNSRLDGIPKYKCDRNFIGESGIKFAFGFGKSKKAEAPVQVAEPVKAVEPEPVKETQVQRPEPAKEVARPKPQPKPQPVEKKAEEFNFQKIYFDVNKANIKTSEESKVKEAAEYLNKNTDKKVEVSGWADPTGNAQLNNNLSKRRANSVKKALVNEGVSADRISASGKGILTEAGDNYEEARTATITEVK
jgi:outer membrane protein OmpA-like peptidoglycan-associated protein